MSLLNQQYTYQFNITILCLQQNILNEASSTKLTKCRVRQLSMFVNNDWHAVEFRANLFNLFDISSIVSDHSSSLLLNALRLTRNKGRYITSA